MIRAVDPQQVHPTPLHLQRLFMLCTTGTQHGVYLIRSNEPRSIHGSRLYSIYCWTCCRRKTIPSGAHTTYTYYVNITLRYTSCENVRSVVFRYEVQPAPAPLCVQCLCRFSPSEGQYNIITSSWLAVSAPIGATGTYQYTYQVQVYLVYKSSRGIWEAVWQLMPEAVLVFLERHNRLVPTLISQVSNSICHGYVSSIETKMRNCRLIM